MRGLGAEREEIPDVIRLLDVGVWVALLGVDEVGELERIANEKDRRVVADEVIVALLRIKLDREAARIARRVGRALLARHGREADEELGAFARGLEKFRLGPLRYVRSDLEITVSPRTFGVDHAFGDAFAAEVGELFDQVIVLEQDRKQIGSAARCGPRAC